MPDAKLLSLLATREFLLMPSPTASVYLQELMYNIVDYVLWHKSAQCL